MVSPQARRSRGYKNSVDASDTSFHVRKRGSFLEGRVSPKSRPLKVSEDFCDEELRSRSHIIGLGRFSGPVQTEDILGSGSPIESPQTKIGKRRSEMSPLNNGRSFESHGSGPLL